MNIFVIGLNHRTAPIEIREQVYLNSTQQDLFLSELRSNPSVAEALVLSTCNRTEIYLHTIDDYDAFVDVKKLIASIKEIKRINTLDKHFYRYQNEQAVHHLFRVSCGLDSLVLGEKQILGQVKAAIERAREKGILGRTFNILSNVAVKAGKKARHETAISSGGSSVSWAAITQAEQTLGTLKGKSVLIIGAGKMSKLTVEQVAKKGFEKLFIMNRTHANAKILAEKYGGEAHSFCDIKEVLLQIDACICSADAPHYVLEHDVVTQIMRQRSKRPLALLDISMPRNIEPSIHKIKNVSLYAIDDLTEIVDTHKKIRESAISEVEAIIEAKLADYERKVKNTRETAAAALKA